LARYKLTLEYAGTRYSGWQIQRNARTVQGALNEALADLARGKRVETYGAGRTDAGVHALGQVAHTDLALELPPATLASRINERLPHDIHVLTAERVPARFHARHSAVARSYLYQIARRRSAFAKPFVWWVKDDLDVNAMQAAAASFIGLIDFRHFTDDDPDEKSTRVLLEQITIGTDGALVLIRVVGSHFLWRMVRRLTGLLVEIGRGRLTAGDLPSLITTESDLVARLTAPASGLFLERVFYDPAPPSWPLVSPVLRVSDPDSGHGV